MIRFEEITNKNIWKVCLLEPFEEQKDFVAENIQSLAEAYATRNEGNNALPLAVYNDDTLIGFVMIGKGTVGNEDESDLIKENYSLWRLMIDKKYQGQGLGKATLDAAFALIRSFPFGPAEKVWLSYEPENTRAREIYRKYGFVENGEMCGNEIVAVYDMTKDRTRNNEEQHISMFSERKPFSEHLMKWEDKMLPDKYDHNFFECCGQPTKDEFAKAVQYQKEAGAGFIKLECDDSLEDSFGLEESVTITMALKSGGTDWTINPDVEFRTPSASELEELEVKHFGQQYGEDFTRRNIQRTYEKLTYHGAYLEGKLVGACHSFCTDDVTCIDGLIVDEAYRKRYVGTSLISHVRSMYPDTTLFLHADEDDTPKQMYDKMGFEEIDKLYEYLCSDITSWEETQR